MTYFSAVLAFTRRAGIGGIFNGKHLLAIFEAAKAPGP